LCVNYEQDFYKLFLPSYQGLSLRILFLSNYYPPHSVGGYEQWCQEVADELYKRGHEMLVLTTHSSKTTGKLAPGNGVVVKDLLNLELDLSAGLLKSTLQMIKDRRRLEDESLNNLRAQVGEFQPEVAMVWGMWNIPRSVPALLESLLPDRVAYYLCDYWPSLPDSYILRWQEKSRSSLMSLPKHILARPVLSYLNNQPRYQLELRNPICVSRRLRDILIQAGLPMKHAQVIYGGTQIDDFKRVPPVNRDHNGILKLLYLGRIRPDKGVHTIVEALELTLRDRVKATLDIIGNGIPDYVESLQKLLKDRDLQSSVSIKPGVPRSRIPELLRTYHALVFPSVWEEPFARTVLEAMAAGLVVVGTTTGGTGEILIEGQTGLTFPVGDQQALSMQISRLAREAGLRESLAVAGQRCVEENYSFTRMVNKLELALKRLSTGA
jgi:glycogen synthase